MPACEECRAVLSDLNRNEVVPPDPRSPACCLRRSCCTAGGSPGGRRSGCGAPGWELRKGEPWLLTITEMNTIERARPTSAGSSSWP